MTPKLRKRVEALDNLHEFRRRCELAEIAWEMLLHLQEDRDLLKIRTRLIQLMDVWHDSLTMLDRAIKLLEDD